MRIPVLRLQIFLLKRLSLFVIIPSYPGRKGEKEKEKGKGKEKEKGGEKKKKKKKRKRKKKKKRGGEKKKKKQNSFNPLNRCRLIII